jgi:hypothetical protein
MCKVVVCGGRDFTDSKFIYSELDRLHALYTFTQVIEGDARGADRIAGQWATKNKIQDVKYPADWEKHGNKAGILRNIQMLELKPDYVICFPGGKGTAHTFKTALKMGLIVIDCKPSGLEQWRIL